MGTRDPFNQMWAEALALLDRADQMHRHFFQPRRASAQLATAEAAARAETAQARWEPPVDILESAEAIHVIVALPGVAPEQVDVTFHAGELAISAQRPWPNSGTHAAIRRLEIPHGRFERRISFPGAALLLTHTRLQHGCLFLTLQKLGA